MQKRLVITLPLAALLAMPAFSQSNQPVPSQPQAQQMQSKPQADQTDASGKQPLTLEQHEGFWGHLNPFARKKYVRKQLTPVVGRVNELDELTASNTKLIKDVDARSTEGIRLANEKASQADSHALDATNRANQANETATQATARLTNVEKVVGNIDQYAKVQDTEIRFRSGQSALSSKAKEALDQMVDPLKSQRGYVVEVQGFAPGRGQAAIASSQKMADSVVRYLVENDVPVYRIYTLGMGSAAPKAEDGKATRVRTGKVEITLLRNDVSGLESAQNAPAGATTPAGANVQGTQAPASALPQNDKPVDQNAPKTQAPVVPKN
jgi:outer membrane protein OmpA-like peptidoglycan-associated protein